MTRNDLGTADYERLYRSLRLIRRAEEEVARIYPSDKIKSPVHLSIGQEAVSVGVCDVLRPDDVVAPTYRGHAAFSPRAAPLRGLFAELYGKATGVAGGKGGSMHLIDMATTSWAPPRWSARRFRSRSAMRWRSSARDSDRVAVAFFGDGATEEGVFAESLNFASLHKLPVLFVCENNYYAIHTPITQRWATTAPLRAGRDLRHPGAPDRRRRRAQAARAGRRGCSTRCAAASGPVFIECRTYRWREHVGPSEDYDQGYRAREDLEPWIEATRWRASARGSRPSRRAEIDAEIEREIADAVAFAEKSPFPRPQGAVHQCLRRAS